jgi:hypothetical protein
MTTSPLKAAVIPEVPMHEHPDSRSHVVPITGAARHAKAR